MHVGNCAEVLVIFSNVTARRTDQQGDSDAGEQCLGTVQFDSVRVL